MMPDETTTVADALAYDRDQLKNAEYVARLIARVDDDD